MKYFFIFAILLPFAAISQLKVEWQKEFEGKNLFVTDFHFKEENIITSLNHVTFRFSSGGELIQSFGDNSGCYAMQYAHDKLFFIGGPHLSIRNEDGVLEQKVTLLGTDNSNISVKDGRVLSDGLFVIENYNHMYKFDLAGNRIFTKSIGDLSTNLFLDAGGNYIYVYSEVSQPALGPRLMQYDTLGNQKWSLPVGDVRAMLADEQGNCYVAPVEVESTLIKYNTDGNILWSRPVTGQFIEGMSKRGDSIFVCGRLKLGSPQNQLCAYSILSASTGEILQQQSFSIYQPATVPEYFSHIASDGKNIYVGGKFGWPGQGEKCFLIKLSKEGNTTSIKEETNSKTSFSIFPNPGGSQFSISCGQSDISTLNVTVRNISGQVVYKKQISCNDQKTFTLDLGKQAAGNYSVEIVSGKDKTVKKIVVE